MMKNDIITVRFNSEVRKNDAIQGGIYHIDNKPLIVKNWMPDIEFTREELQSEPIWAMLEGLDFTC